MMIHTDEVYYTPVVTASDVTALEYYHMWYVTDHQGNIRAVTDGTGTVLRTNHYDPYGEEVLPVLTSASTLPTSTAGTDAASRYMYGAKEWDSNVSLYDFSARWYNPAGAVSFTTIDPLCEKYYAISPYAYCAGDPVNLVDKNGKQIIPWPLLYRRTATVLEHNGKNRTQKTIGFAMNQPLVAIQIGKYDARSHNISSVASFFSINLTKSIGSHIEGEGSVSNALRHTIWQAIDEGSVPSSVSALKQARL